MNALTDAATAMAQRGGPDAVVLRAAAREAGVSAAAAYRHFAHHGELLHAVRDRAISSLGEAMRVSLRASEPMADPADEALRKFWALGRAYTSFALGNPGLFRTAFCRPDKPTEDVTARMKEHGPYELLSAVLDELVQTGVLDPGRRPDAEIAVWAAVHGLATLLLDGPLALLDEDQRAAAIRVVDDFVLAAITAPPR